MDGIPWLCILAIWIGFMAGAWRGRDIFAAESVIE
jgi:hypothetical protein